MKLKAPRKHTSYFYYIVALVVLILVVSAGGGLAIVYLRQQITLSAAKTKETETEITSLDRKIQHLDTRIAAVHHPDSLRRRAESLGLTLTQPAAKQVVRMEATASQRTWPAEADQPEPLMVSFDLALMDPSLAPVAKAAKNATATRTAKPASTTKPTNSTKSTKTASANKSKKNN
ncbi:MAG: hypothetical protein SFY80_04425 [Verrucomicrobiota bacterium]|nr:hypothetical protein [Verrucomicrobiota bacterium]